MKERVDVVWPSGKVAERAQPLAPRLPALEGKTICAVSNGVFRFEETWPLVKQSLARRYPGVKFVDYNQFGEIHGLEEMARVKALPQQFKQHGCDAVVSGRGC